ncbi:MAG: hypothetical protein IJS90_08525 [Clostridia bacterium]|nr:hypothetical protein [Clostridia bacterium]
MNSVLKKTVCILLALALFVPAFASSVCAASDVTPIVYVYGYRGVYVHREDGTFYTPIDEDKYPDENADPNFLTNVVKELLPDLAKAVLTNDYDAYCAKALELLTPIYDEIRPNPDGTVPENTDCGWSWNYNSINANPNANTIYGYDWDTRLSPMDVADDLNDYIEAIKQKTGAGKVVLVSRCAGTEVAAAYLYKYQKPVGYEGIKKALFIASTLKGYDYFELIASGNVTIPADSLYRYTKFNDVLGAIDNAEVYEFIDSTLGMLESTAGLKLTLSLVESIYAKIKDKLISPFLKSFYGISLGQVGAICDHYEEYKDYIFREEGDKEKYSAIISKADDYHYNVQMNIETMFNEMNGSGVKVYIVAGYGEQAYPIGETSEYVGDQYGNIKDLTFGANMSKLTGTLSNEYIASRVAAGCGRYISPDSQVDASTCLFPDQTWIVKNLRHDFNGNDVLSLVYAVARTDDITVNTLSAFPQFLNAKDDHSAFEPAKAVNENDINWDAYEEEAQQGSANLLQKLVDFIVMLVSKISGLVRGILERVAA